MEIILFLAVIIGIGIYVVWSGNKAGPPKPETMSYTNIMSRLSSESNWLTRYSRLQTPTDQVLTGKAHGKFVYIQSLRSELATRLGLESSELASVLMRASAMQQTGVPWEKALIAANVEYLAKTEAEERIVAERQTAIAARKTVLENLSPEESWCLEESLVLLDKLFPHSYMGIPSPKKVLVRDLFLRTKALAEQQYGSDICRKNRGDELIVDLEYMEARLESGLTTEDVRSYWNQPLLMALLVPEVHMLVKFLCEDQMTKHQNISAIEAECGFRHSHVIYGDPALDIEHVMAIKGYTEDDAALFIEFDGRVSQWLDKLDVSSRREILMGSKASLNAKVRSLVLDGQM